MSLEQESDFIICNQIAHISRTDDTWVHLNQTQYVAPNDTDVKVTDNQSGQVTHTYSLEVDSYLGEADFDQYPSE